MTSWPPGLPPAPDVDSYEETLPDITIRTQMDTGMAKVRRRFTAAVKPLSMVFTLDPDQAELLEVFYRDTCAGGAITFDFTHPRNGIAIVLRFAGPPVLTPIGPLLWRGACKMEIMP